MCVTVSLMTLIESSATADGNFVFAQIVTGDRLQLITP